MSCPQVDKALQGTLSSVVASAGGFQAQREAVAQAVGRSRAADAAAAAEAAAATLLEAGFPRPGCLNCRGQNPLDLQDLV
jgi:hypothetical protein